MCIRDSGYPVAQLPDWMHPHMVDFIVRDRIKNTKLSVDQVDTMFRLQNHNMSGIELAVEGKTGGFKIKLIDDLGINGDFVESQAFAYLAIRSYLGLPISFPTTTGCKNPCTGGVIVKNF